LFDGIGRHVERPGHGVERQFLLLYAHDRKRERLHETTQTRVARKCPYQRTGAREGAGHVFEAVAGHEPKAVTTKKRPATLLRYRPEKIRFLCEILREGLRRRFGELGRRTVHDDEYELHALGKMLVIRNLALPPTQLGRQEVIDVGVDRKVASHVEGGAARQQ